ncbi:MAG: hypothetical protein JNN01_16320 [Opitutaceae bacterium]|nr:hypothetical protein [Opitutaceae bacterium]
MSFSVWLGLMAGTASTALASPPPNDNFVSRFSFGSTPSAVTTGSNVGASLEPSEPDPIPGYPGFAGASVWWSWVAPSTGPVLITTAGSSFDTVLGVYTGTSLPGLSLVAFNDDDGGLQAQVTFVATAGTTYHISVTGFIYVNVGYPESGFIALQVGPAGSSPAIATPPADLEVIEGQPAVFSVVATGAGPLSYSWQRLPFQGNVWQTLGTTPGFSGTTTERLTIPTTSLSQSGDQYRCIVGNSLVGILSPSAYLVVQPAFVAASLIEQPSDLSVPVGTNASFSVTAVGSAPLNYQWQRMAVGGNTWVNLVNAGSYSGVTTRTVTVSSTVLTMNGDRFRCLVTNSGSQATSTQATLNVTPPNQPPAFVAQPASITANEGTSATFVVVVGGNPPPSLQWERSVDNGNSFQAVAGATAATLRLDGLLFSQTGHRYRVRAVNAAGSLVSSVATLTVLEVILPTQITTQPTGGILQVGASVTLSVAASGTGPFTYAWYKDGRPISGATASTLSLNNLTATDTAGYFVAVTGRGGRAESRSALITVLRPPQFTVQPVDVQVQVGLNAAFRVVASGEPPPSVQWFSRTGTGAWTALADGGQFNGVSTSLLSVGTVTAGQNGLQFQARATNGVGSADSAVATLRTTPASSTLRIRSQPQSVLVRAGQSAQFTVEMEGNGPYTFQWSQNGVTRTGATNSICRLATTTADSVGGFSVVVTDATGASVTSNVAYLTVAGAVDPNFDPRGGPDGEVTEILSLSDGGYLVAGSFDRFAGVARNRLVRLLKSGAVDGNFDPAGGPNGPVRAMLELKDGKYIIVGQFDRFDQEVVPGVVRVDSKGRLDPTFSADLPLPFIGRESEIPALERFQFAVIGLRGGGYLLGGKLGLVALRTTGAHDPQTVYRTTGGVFSLLQQFDGGILAGGDFTVMSGFVRSRMARLSEDFRMDLSFDVGTGPNGSVRTLLRAPDGAIYVMGSFTSFNGQPRASGIAKIGPRGQLDANFSPALAPVTASSDSSTIASGGSRPTAGRLDAIRAGQVQPNGGLVVSNGINNAQSVVAINPSGSIAANDTVTVTGSANALSITENEGVAVGGDFSTLAGSDRSNLGVVVDSSNWSRLINLSCRARVSPANGVLILGFVIEGPDAMRILVRGAGPTLRNYGITDAVARPQITLFNAAGQVIDQNLGWQTVADPTGLAQAMAQVGAFPFTAPEDTAILINLPPGAYTAHIGGYQGSQGVALGEIYAVDLGRSRLVNSAVRGPVGTGENLLIPGFTVSGGSRLLLLRAVGPTLGGFGVPNTLAQPKMELKRSNGTLVATNQGWRTGFDPAAVQVRSNSVGAFPLGATSLDAALLTSLEAGGFTITVSGADGGTGAALVEVYDANGVEEPVLNQ